MTRPVFALKYLTRFHCIADRCEDTCCAGMQIPLTTTDQARLTAALGAAGHEHVTLLPAPVHGCSAVLSRTETGACRLLDPRGLCSLVVRAGDAALPDACALFPRTVAQTPHRVELAGSLACPEAARLCLLSEDGTELIPADSALLARFSEADFAPPEPFDALADVVRDAALAMLRDRRWPIRTRLMHLAALGARCDTFLFRGSTDDHAPERLRDELNRARTEHAWRETHDALEHSAGSGAQVVQMLFSLMTGLRGRGTARFGQLVDAVTLTYQTAALELEPGLGTAPQPTLLWNTLWRALCEKRARAEHVFGDRLEVLLERYWVNDLYRAPHTRAASLGAHAFQMLLRGAVLRFVALGHPTIDALAAKPALTDDDGQALDAAFIEAVQLYAKHIEKDADMFAMLAAHFSLDALQTDALGRARVFAAAT